MVIKKSLWKDCFREIRKNLSRYFSLMAIVCLGVGFFAGINAASPDMLETADAYFKEYNLMDLQFVSTMGLTDKDLSALLEQPDIKDAEAGYTIDALSHADEEDRVFRVHSLPSSVNQTRLTDGRYPENSGECIIENSPVAAKQYSIGSQIQLSLPEDDILDSLKTDTYTVVGYAESPYYMSQESSASALGNGSVDAFMMILPEGFSLEAYTDLYATLHSAGGVAFDSEEYGQIISSYKDSIGPFTAERETLRYQEVVAEAREKLEENRQEYEDGLRKAEEEFAKAKQELDDAKIELDNGQKELDRNRTAANRELAAGRQQIDDAKTLLEEQELELQKGITQFEEAKPGMNAQKKQLQDALVPINENIAQIDAAMNLPGVNQAELEAQKQILLLQKFACEQGISDIDTGIASQQGALDEAQKQIDTGKTELEENEKTYNATRQSTLATLDDTQATLDSGYKEYEDGLAEYETSYRDTYAELDEAKVKLDEAEEEIDSIEAAVWYTFDRDSITGYSGYNDNVGRIAAIAVVFPVFFLLIAALVCLTSMTRMVEDNRTQIGTYKAFGYSNGAISLKYILYSVSATLIGGFIGLAIGFKLFPTIVFNAYKILYIMPEVNAPFRWDSGMIALLLSLAVILFATLSVCYKELQEVPSQLMRPKAPKVGKKVLLEKITFIWTRLTFIRKVTVRNLFRYKKRMLMTIIGIAGCAALMLCGFGIRDSISTITDKQFGEIFRYDMIVVLDDEEGSDTAYLQDTQTISGIGSQLPVYSETMTAKKEGESVEVTMMIPETPEEIGSYISLVSKDDESSIVLDETGVVLTRKAADLLGLEIGDPFTVEDEDYGQFTCVVAAISTNYAFHYMYMTPSYYELVRDNAPASNQVLVNCANDSTDALDALASDLLQSESVLGVSKMYGIGDQFKDTMSSLNIVVFVLIICAGILAFVVLFNLVSVNITERTREIATIKVLGFFDKEVTAYLYRENVILTIIGIAVGLVLGIFLHGFVMNTVELDMVVFSRDIFPLSYVFSTVLTIAFSVIVNIFTHFKLMKIDMIESLKSVE